MQNFLLTLVCLQSKKKPPSKPGIPTSTSVVEENSEAADKFKVELQWCVQQLEAAMKKASLKESMQHFYSYNIIMIAIFIQGYNICSWGPEFYPLILDMPMFMKSRYNTAKSLYNLNQFKMICLVHGPIIVIIILLNQFYSNIFKSNHAHLEWLWDKWGRVFMLNLIIRI